MSTPWWKRKSVWAVIVGAVTAAGVLIGALTIEDAGAIVDTVGDIVKGISP